MEPKNCWFVHVSPFPRVVWAFAASMFIGLLKRLWKFNKLYYHLTNQTCPKDHLTLHWKGLNLHSRGWVLKITSFEGSGSLGWKTHLLNSLWVWKPMFWMFWIPSLETLQRLYVSHHSSNHSPLIGCITPLKPGKFRWLSQRPHGFWGSHWLVFQEFQGIYCLKMSDDIYRLPNGA